MNKETIEEAARRIFGDDEDGNYLEKRAFIKGAKWQQEKYANELPEPYNYGINSDKKRGFIEGVKWQTEQNNTSKVNRVEVIQHSDPYNGRAYTNYNASNVEMYLQDDSKTLKIFLI